MRPPSSPSSSSSHTASVPPDNAQLHGPSHPQPSDTESTPPTTHHPIGTGAGAGAGTRYSQSSLAAPCPQPVQPPRRTPDHDPSADVDMVDTADADPNTDTGADTDSSLDSDQDDDSDSDPDPDSSSGAELDSGGASLLVSPAIPRTAVTSMPVVDSDPEYMSDAFLQDYENERYLDSDPSRRHPHTGARYLMGGPLADVFQVETQPSLPPPTAHPVPSGPTDLANLPPLPQPPAGWVPLPAGGMGFEFHVAMSNGNPSVYGSENFGLADFLRDWEYQARFGRAAHSGPPLIEELARQIQEEPQEIDASQLDGDRCDLQGLDWTSMGTTRKAARNRRNYTYRNYVNRVGSDKWMTTEEPLTRCENFYRFNKMTIRKDVCLAHFQLRSVLACPTRTHAYYPTSHGITRMNLASSKSDLFVNLRNYPAFSAGVSTMDAACGVLMCGTFNGDYYLKRLDASEQESYVQGQITSDLSNITNHIKIHTPRRSCGPAAAIASNDQGFRLLDLETQKFVQQVMYPFALNCTAVSPDRRLRAVVGDHFDVLITNADTGEVLRQLAGHRDYGFSCDWSDDGWTVATGFQDMAVKIWDARRWCDASGRSTPLCTVRTEMAGARSLRFSPLGSGEPPVLVAAEEADHVNVVDVRTLRRRQTVDVFGEIGGVAFANEGQDLNVLCCDALRGGLLQLHRRRGEGAGAGLLRTRRTAADAGLLRGRKGGELLLGRRSWLPDTETTPALNEIPAFF